MSEARTDTRTDPGIAIALGSAFLGVYTHGGFLCGLEQAGIFPGHVSGASAGALAGGFYAAGIRGADLQRLVLSGALKRSFVDPGLLYRWVPMMTLGRLTGLLNGKRVIRHLRSELPVASIDEIEGIKLQIAVTDLRKQQSHFITRGPLAEAMMASCAVPLLFSEQVIDGIRYSDGGILHELPFEPFVHDPDIHTIIIHSIRFHPTRRQQMMKVPAVFSSSHRMLNDALVTFRREQAERLGKRVILMQTEHPHPGWLQSAAEKQRYFEEGYRTGLSLKKALHPPCRN